MVLQAWMAHKSIVRNHTVVDVAPQLYLSKAA